MSALNARVDLPPTPAAARAARLIVHALLEVWRAEHCHDDAVLLVNEVVSNAVEHVVNEASLELDLSLSDGRLCISLTDGSSVRPVVREMDRGSDRGRGMQIVEALADTWGAHDHEGGKRVWFELASPSRPRTRQTSDTPPPLAVSRHRAAYLITATPSRHMTAPEPS